MFKWGKNKKSRLTPGNYLNEFICIESGLNCCFCLFDKYKINGKLTEVKNFELSIFAALLNLIVHH